jgi:hypothetical protein
LASGSISHQCRSPPIDLKNGLVRPGKLVSGFGHLFMGLVAGGMALGPNGSGGSQSEESWTAKLLTFGRVLVGAIGMTIIGFALGQIW